MFQVYGRPADKCDMRISRANRHQIGMAKPSQIIPVERVASRIYLMRTKKVMLDFDLAELYGVPTRVLNQAVTRNKSRFPADFMFRLTSVKAAARDKDRSQIELGS